MVAVSLGASPRTVDLVFPAAGGDVPTDHAYRPYRALSQLVPAFHEAGRP